MCHRNGPARMVPPDLCSLNDWFTQVFIGNMPVASCAFVQAHPNSYTYGNVDEDTPMYTLSKLTCVESPPVIDGLVMTSTGLAKVRPPIMVIVNLKLLALTTS